MGQPNPSELLYLKSAFYKLMRIKLKTEPDELEAPISIVRDYREVTCNRWGFHLFLNFCSFKSWHSLILV